MHKTAHEMQPDAATRAASGSNPPSDQQKSQAENIRLAAKLRERRMRWEWNRKLGVVSIALLVLVAIGSFISYRYHSRTAAETFRLRAEEAFADGDFEAQIKWLRRYALLKPNDIESLVALGVAADEAADLAELANRFSAVSSARKQLSSSIARLSNLD